MFSIARNARSVRNEVSEREAPRLRPHHVVLAALGLVSATLALVSPPAAAAPQSSGSLSLGLPWQHGTAITELPFTISQPGTFFISRNLTGVPGQEGIRVTADDVTLELNGFTLQGVPGSLDAIWAPTAVRNLRIRNGTLRGWGKKAVEAFSSELVQIERVTASYNQGGGLFVGHTSTVSDSAALWNTGVGFRADRGSTLIGCTASNQLASGIFTNGECLVRSCVAIGNDANGIEVKWGTLVESCSSTASGASGFYASGEGCVIKSSTARGNGQNGIDARQAVIDNCAATQNAGTGIWAKDRSQVNACVSMHNGTNYRLEGNSQKSNSNG